MDAAHSPDARTVPTPARSAQEVFVDMEKMMNRANVRLENPMEETEEDWETRVPRFPQHPRGIGGQDNRFVEPSVVAIGPYPYDVPRLQAMEEVKRAAAYSFCRALGRSVQEVYESILSVAGTMLVTPDQGIAPITGPLLSPAREAPGDIEEAIFMATERLGTRASVMQKRMHKFPEHLREIGGPDERYVVPSVVAIGPYHHGLPHLQAMEEVKHVAASQICRDLGRSVNEVYEKILSISGDARRCYTVDDVVASLSDAEFATMMFLDGCFLLKFMINNEPPIAGHALSCWPTIAKDTLLLENQIPLLVLEAFMEYFDMDKLVCWFIDSVNEVYFFDRKETKKNPRWIIWLQRLWLQNFLMRCRREPEEKTNTGDESSTKSPHLLGLLRLSMICDMPSEKREGRWTPNSSLWLSSSAVHLSQVGVKLTASTARWFADMNVQKKPLFGELSLSPLFLNDIVACILVNLVGLEAAQATDALSSQSDGLVVSSYLSVLAMLMDREEDVQQLRARGVLCGHFSNTQALAFFKGLGQHLRLGFNYFRIVQEIDDYMRNRPVRTVVHKFVYNNYKLIAAVLSVVSVLVGIFKALYSLKKP